MEIEEGAFCEQCWRTITYVEVKKETLYDYLDDKKYTYTGFVAYCPICHCTVWTAFTHDYNLKALYKKRDEEIKNGRE